MATRGQGLALGVMLGAIPGILMLIMLAVFVPDAIIEWAVAFLLIGVGVIAGGSIGWRRGHPRSGEASHTEPDSHHVRA